MVLKRTKLLIENFLHRLGFVFVTAFIPIYLSYYLSNTIFLLSPFVFLFLKCDDRKYGNNQKLYKIRQIFLIISILLCIGVTLLK